MVVLHGGPGAIGSAAPLSRSLAEGRGILEALVRSASLTRQISDVAATIEGEADAPVALVGHSWGAVLAYLVAAHHPAVVRKIVMVSTAPVTKEDAAELAARRMAALEDDEREELVRLQIAMQTGKVTATEVARFDALAGREAHVAPITAETSEDEFLPHVYARVLYEFRNLEAAGKLPDLGRSIACPVSAIHGADDPHPMRGVEALGEVVTVFRLLVLERCGHVPWNERHAREPFFDLLEAELAP